MLQNDVWKNLIDAIFQVIELFRKFIIILQTFSVNSKSLEIKVKKLKEFIESNETGYNSKIFLKWKTQEIRKKCPLLKGRNNIFWKNENLKK